MLPLFRIEGQVKVGNSHRPTGRSARTRKLCGTCFRGWDYFFGLVRLGFRNRTPGPPPFSSMNLIRSRQVHCAMRNASR
jgi:hypothetical protein